MTVELEGLSEISVPMPWHSEAWQTLQELHEAERLPGSLLISGAPHIGKKAFGMALSRALLCVQPQSGFNCGQCHPCELSAAGTLGDLLWVQPEEKSKVIKIEQVRQAIRFTQGTANFGHRKALVVAPANSMNVNAFNALLKCLEEPGDGTHIILLCDSLHGIPATIRSRCQKLQLRAPNEAEGLAWLANIVGDDSLARQTLELAEGRPLLAEQLYRDDALEAFAQRRLDIRALLEGEALSVGGALADDDPQTFLSLFLAELRQRICQFSATELNGPAGRRAFELMDEALQMQRAVEAGANPGRQLLQDLFLSKSHRLLGA